ncbi:hypothetical protein [Azospirillum doebereinerae]
MILERHGDQRIPKRTGATPAPAQTQAEGLPLLSIVFSSPIKPSCMCER